MRPPKLAGKPYFICWCLWADGRQSLGLYKGRRWYRLKDPASGSLDVIPSGSPQLWA